MGVGGAGGCEVGSGRASSALVFASARTLAPGLFHPILGLFLHYNTHTHTNTQVKSLYPKALATTILANHCSALAQELLSAGQFKLARALLLVAEADLTMATGAHSPKTKNSLDVDCIEHLLGH
jgi:hypothetical protein